MRIEQEPTQEATLEWVMNKPEFALGVLDQRAGRGYRAAYATWGVNEQWNYERGRAWATVAPRSVPLKVGKRLNPAALKYAGVLL
jgi:hypothetical protein